VRTAFRGLLSRLLLGLVVVGVAPLALTAVSLAGVNREAMLTQVLRTHALAARAVAERIAAFVGARHALLAGLAAHPALAAPHSEVGQDVLRDSLSAWADLGAVGLAVLDPAGAEVVRVQLRDRGPAVDAALATPLAPGATAAWTTLSAVSRGASGEAVAPREAGGLLRIGVPLGGGQLALVADASELQGLLRPEEIGEEAEMVLLDQSGRLLADPRPATANVELAQRFPADVLEVALSGRLGGAGRFGSGEDRRVGAYAPVVGAPWVVLSLQPSRVAEAAAARMARQSGVALLAACGLIGLLTTIAFRTVVQPLRAVIAAQRRLLGVVGPEPPAHERGAAGAAAVVAGTEVDELSRNLARLELGLRDRAAVDRVFLGRYQVIEVLGSGAMGTVFRGWDPKLERAIALKTVRLAGTHPDGVDRQALVTRLLREAVTVARFNHPNIVGIYDLAEAPEAAVLAMELVDGPSLEVLIWKCRSLPSSLVVPLGAAIARGLAVAHQHGVVHRDVKPANILLGRDGAIKVSDFGIAELAAAAATVGNRVFGTPGYLSPEALEGQACTARSDLFALGATLHFCLVGSGPFHARSTREIVRRTLRGDVLPLGRRHPEIDPDLDRLVTAMLRRDPGARPETAAAVADELEQLATRRGYRWQLPRADAGGNELLADDPAEAELYPPPGSQGLSSVVETGDRPLETRDMQSLDTRVPP
jgi:serine/threonine-protein kinase